MIIVLGNGLLGSELVKQPPQECVQLIRKDIDLEKNDVQEIRSTLFNANPNFHDDGFFPVGLEYPRNTYLINAAAYTDVDGAESNQDKAYKTNAEGAYKLAIACKALGVTLLHISTDFVFDGISSKPFAEFDHPNPVNYYGYTKLMSEKMIMNSGCKYAIVRSGWLYNDSKGLVPNLLGKVVRKEKLIGVQDQKLTPTHVKDLSKQLFTICENNLTGVFHATPEGYTTPIDLIKLLSKEVHGEESSVWPVNKCGFLENGAQRPLNCVLENMNLKALGMSTLPHWKDSVLTLLRKRLSE